MKKLLIILLASSLSVGNATEKSLSREDVMTKIKELVTEVNSKDKKLKSIVQVYTDDCTKDKNITFSMANNMSVKDLNSVYLCMKESLDKAKKELSR